MKEEKILSHNFIPKHTILGEKEIKELLSKYNVLLKQLPKISVNDPMVKSLGAKKGDVLKIMRKSPTAKEAVFYRSVTDA
jgi:DNA-directed RNA polymerase subunit H|tara:strand:+ start:35178 stop:35417 length:240 start_codon:yes stop_codon:yes gene_type:complete